MKNLVMLIGLLSCMLAPLQATDVTQAKELVKQTELAASCQEIQQYLTLPAGTSAEQRALVAVTLAATESKNENPAEISAAFYNIRKNTAHLLLSDTDFVWESQAWVGKGRNGHFYNSEYRQTRIVNDTSSGVTWAHDHQTIYAYDGSGKLNISTYQSWESSNWVNESMGTHSYDGDGNLTQVLGQVWTGSAWDNSSKWIGSYSSGRVDSIIIQIWWSGTSIWKNEIKYTYAYDGNGNPTLWLVQEWDGNAWTNDSRFTDTYNASGDLVHTLIEEWQSDAWVVSVKHDRTYDASHHEILAVSSVWEGTDWVEALKDSTKYTGGLPTERVEVNLLAATVSRTQYAYDADDNNTQVLSQDWVQSEGQWVNVSRLVRVFGVPAISCGDFNASGLADISDVVYLVAYVFFAGPAPADPRGGDVNCSGAVNVGDIVYLINYIFRGGPAPCEACP
jgi:hypothetical protein